MCVCEEDGERQSWPREGITMPELRHSDWHHIQTERGGTEGRIETKTGRDIKRKMDRKGNKDRKRVMG